MSARNVITGAIACCALITVGGTVAATAVAVGRPSAAPARTTLAWQPSQPAPGIIGGGVGSPDSDAVSCARDYCVLAGTEPTGPAPGGGDNLFSGYVWPETNGRWGAARMIPGLAALSKDAAATAVGCASPGNCAVGGWYDLAPLDGSGAYVSTELGGAWGKAARVTGLPALNGGFAAINAISCPAPGACVAAGSFTAPYTRTRPFLVTQTHGKWGKAMALPSVTALGGTYIESLDCPSAGYCAAVGDGLGGYNQGATSSPAFILTETNGTWAKAVRVTGTSAGTAGLASVSCAAPGYCVAGGEYTPVMNGPTRALLVTETGGRWGRARSLPVGTETIIVVSCPAKGDCAAATGRHLVTERGGTWGKPASAPPGYLVLSLACARAGYCGGAGFYHVVTSTSLESAIGVVDQVGGSWQPWTLLPGTIVTQDPKIYWRVSPMSCGTPGNCVLYGHSDDQYGPVNEWVADKQAVPVTTTRLALSTARLTYGDEQSGLVQVSVTATSGTPDGTVTVAAGATTLCTVTLSAGTGSCALSAKALPPGTYAVTAVYGINAGFAASRATPAMLKITQPASSL
jgi:hypothetical protein